MTKRENLKQVTDQHMLEFRSMLPAHMLKSFDEDWAAVLEEYNERTANSQQRSN